MANIKKYPSDDKIATAIEAAQLKPGDYVSVWGILGIVKAVLKYDGERKAVVCLEDTILKSPPPLELQTNTIVVDTLMCKRVNELLQKKPGVIWL